MRGIEPAFSAWEADVLPLNYTRETVVESEVIIVFGNARYEYPNIQKDQLEVKPDTQSHQAN